MESTIYQTKTGELQVKLYIWATQAQIAMIFDKDSSVITKHINNLLKNKEIARSNVQKTHIASADSRESSR